MGKRVYNVYIDLIGEDDTVYTETLMSGYVSNSINEQEINEATDRFEGLFDFFFPEHRFGLIGNWKSGVVHRGLNVLLKVTPFAKVRIVRGSTEFVGFISPDGIALNELTPGFHRTDITVLSYPASLKLIPAGKITDFVDSEHPDRTFSLYRKTVQQIPPGKSIPRGADPESYIEDVDYYIRAYDYNYGQLAEGDKSEFQKVTIFDTKTLSNDIGTDSDSERPFYKRAFGDSIYYSHGIKSMPLVPIIDILREAVACANRYFEVRGVICPTFTIPDQEIPPKVFIQAIPVITGVWHSCIRVVNSRTLAFIWKNQFDVEIFEITNRTQITSIGNYSFSRYFSRASLNSLKGNHLRIRVDGRERREITSRYSPTESWDFINNVRLRNPFVYNNNHPDGDFYATYFGSSGDKVFFGWWTNRHQTAEYSEYNDYLSRVESSVFMHVVSLDIVTGAIRAESGPTIDNPSDQHFYDDLMLTRWSAPGIGYAEGSFYHGTENKPHPDVSDFIMHVPLLTGDNQFTIQTKTYAEYFDILEADGEWCKFALRYPPREIPYRRSSYAVVYTGIVGSTSLSLFLENKKISDIILLVCKLTNSTPVVEADSGEIKLRFRQRKLRSEIVDNPVDYNYILDEKSILQYFNKTESYELKESGVVIDLGLDNTPDAVQEAFSDFYEEEFIPEGFNLHLFNVPLHGENIPSWIDTIQHGDTVLARGKVLEYIGRRNRYLSATIVLEER